MSDQAQVRMLPVQPLRPRKTCRSCNPSFDALGLVTFQISPHFQDPDPNSKHMGETQEERILQFLEENDTPVAGLREGAIVRIENGVTLLKGSTGARIFRKGMEPVETLPGDRLDALFTTGQSESSHEG